MSYREEDILRKMQELRDSIETQEKEIHQMKDQLGSLELAHKVMTTVPSNDRQVSLVEGHRFRSMGLQDACLEILNEASKPLFREEVSEGLLMGGYITRSNRFRDVVGTTLNNLYKANKIERLERKDRVVYTRNEGSFESGESEQE